MSQNGKHTAQTGNIFLILIGLAFGSVLFSLVWTLTFGLLGDLLTGLFEPIPVIGGGLASLAAAFTEGAREHGVYAGFTQGGLIYWPVTLLSTFLSWRESRRGPYLELTERDIRKARKIRPTQDPDPLAYVRERFLASPYHSGRLVEYVDRIVNRSRTLDRARLKDLAVAIRLGELQIKRSAPDIGEETREGLHKILLEVQRRHGDQLVLKMLFDFDRQRMEEFLWLLRPTLA